MNIKNGWLITRLNCYDKELKELTDKETSIWIPFAIRINEIYAVKEFTDKENSDCNGKSLIFTSYDSFVVEIKYEEMESFLTQQKVVFS